MVDRRPPDPLQRATGRSSQELLWEVLLTGIAVLVPVAITLYVLYVIVGALARLLTPLVGVFPASGIVGFLLAGATLLVTVLAVGFVAHFRTGRRAIDFFDAAIGRVPGIGAVYRSFRRMSDVMLESDADQFREVKLVSFPAVNAYMIGFVTAKDARRVVDAVDGPVITLFVPLAPNPVMGGFVVHVPEEHVHDIDLSVEEGFRATVTSGVALGEEGAMGTGGVAGEPWELPEPARTAVDEVEDLRELRLADLRRLAGRGEEELTVGDLRDIEIADLEARLFGDRRPAGAEPTDRTETDATEDGREQ